MPQLRNSDLKTSNSRDPLRILHVDDDPSILEVSKSILELEGDFEVDSVSSVDDALEKLVEQAYDMVVSDYEMPNKNGLDFLRTLREQKNMIPFALFTGKGREDVAMTALNLGADGYYNKQGSAETVYGELAHGIKQSVERKKSVLALASSEEKFKVYIENSPVAIFVANPQGKYEYVNNAACKLLGYSKEELLEMSIPQIIFKQNNHIDLKKFEEVKETGQSLSETALKTKEGLPVYVILNSAKLPDGKLIAFCENITQRKMSEEALKNRESLLQKIFEILPVGLWFADKDGNLLRGNPAGVKIWGAEPKVVPSEYGVFKARRLPSREEVAPDDWALSHTIKDKVTIVDELLEIDAFDGKKKTILNYTAPVLDAQGDIQGAIVVNQDITERKTTEDEIRSMSKFPLQNPNPVFRVAKDGTVLFANAAAKRILEKEKSGVGKLVPIGGRQWVSDVFKSGLTKENKIELEDKVFSFVFTPIIDEGYVNIYGRDITDRKRMEKSLVESQKKFQNLIETTGEFIWEMDPQGRYTYCSPQMTKIWGLKPHEMIGKTPFDIMPLDDKRKALEVFGAMEESPKPFSGLQTTAYDGQGRLIFVETNGVPFFDEQGRLLGYRGISRDISERKKAEEKLLLSERKYREFADSLPEIVFETDDRGVFTFLNKKASEIMGYSIDEMKQANFMQFLAPKDRQKAILNMQKRMLGDELSGNEYMLLKKDGSVFPAIIFSERVIHEDGKVGLRGVFVNISQTKKAAEKLEMMNEKLRVVGGLTRHDVRNKLSIVTGYAYLLKKKHKDQVDIVDGLGKMEQAVKESMRIFEFAKMYEQLGVEELTYVDVEKTVNEAVALFSGLTIKVVNNCQGLTVLADTFLRQLFFNFIDNTEKYGEKTTIARAHYQKTKSGELQLTYEDDGVGINAENKPKLFGEGFSTGGSTGFGLFLIRKMMDVYGWQIQETGEPGKGAKFTITIPRVNQNGKENFRIA